MSSLQTVSRAVEVLRCFDGGARALSLAELTRVMGLNKVTVLRLAQSLTQEGLLGRNTDNGKYVIAHGLPALSRHVAPTSDLIELAMPVLREAQSTSRETVTLNIRHGLEAVAIAELVSPEAIKYSLGSDYRADLRLGAVGWAILSELCEAELQRVVALPAPRFAQGLVVTEAVVRERLEEIRSHGVATSVGQRVKDAAGYAAPFFLGGAVAGAIGVLLPASRNSSHTHRNCCIGAATKAADQLNSLLECSPHAEQWLPQATAVMRSTGAATHQHRSANIRSNKST